MYNAPWKQPIAIEMPRPHGMQVVRTTQEAADCLIDKWPEPDFGPERDEALRLCLEVYENGEEPEKARDAFLRAAHAADLFVHERVSS
ncbi:DUF982 domain-containing protein [Rhizobium sp. RAF36]|jgi:hypothetical protein|uniref:DUF982 domain-containing protein n=1 Tax=Rhizobium sp. RAF36 TaxID=3233055 RepID=UPI003F995532